MLNKNKSEGYVYTSYGDHNYLRDAIVSAHTIRRYDRKRPIAVYVSDEHKSLLEEWGLSHHFDVILSLNPENQSITGFKHNLHLHMPFDANLYLDSDMIWCREPDSLWDVLRPYPYTITGQNSADVFFGAPKSFGVAKDIIFRRRQRTLKRFDLSFLYRVQTGMMYNADYDTAKKVDDTAKSYLKRQAETHFISRKREKGRTLESCEWSLGMAMTKLELFVYPWFNGYESPQLDYINGMVQHDSEYEEVKVQLYCNPFIHSLRGIATPKIRRFLIGLFNFLPRSQDHMWVTPYVLHFGWGHQKKYWNMFSERTLRELKGTAFLKSEVIS